ncbi:CPBP family intramembrane glutamic endopeptidase [Endozoicomonas sp. ALD040]|uniref:CPBP family intramembrane glutamic endopeptidase n=2 Tax=unclassified Endozoicomonas TaxID=2644528 RepID=UPI003BAF9C7A
MKTFLLITLLLCPLIASSVYEEKPESSVRIISRQIMIGVICGTIEFTFSTCIVVPIASIFLPEGQRICDDCATSRPVFIRGLALVVGSAMEEVFFRFYLQPMLNYVLCRRLCRPRSFIDTLFVSQRCIASDLSLCFSNIFFGFCHLLGPNWSTVQAFSATVAGFYFSYIYNHHGPIAVITCHATHNLIWLALRPYLKR